MLFSLVITMCIQPNSNIKGKDYFAEKFLSTLLFILTQTQILTLKPTPNPTLTQIPILILILKANEKYADKYGGFSFYFVYLKMFL